MYHLQKIIFIFVLFFDSAILGIFKKCWIGENLMQTLRKVFGARIRNQRQHLN